jgi:hypothetical protein
MPTVRLILNPVDLRPHRTRYWRTSRIDPEFKDPAEKALSCCGSVNQLARQGYQVVRSDEVLIFQVREWRPIRRSIRGSIEQQEFGYVQHGTVNLLAFLILHTGRMRTIVREQNDAPSFSSHAEAIPAQASFAWRVFDS